MSTKIKHAGDEALHISQLIRRERSLAARTINLYWRLSFLLTRLIERYYPVRIISSKEPLILNFGCGNNFIEPALNTDSFALHRFIKRKRRPDLYFSGTYRHPRLASRFDGIVCEHVIEHILPDDVLTLFKFFKHCLKHGSNITISFPDARTILTKTGTQGFTDATVSLNSVIYRYGHTFMYDTEIVCELLRRAGFVAVKSVAFEECGMKVYLERSRRPESAYVQAEAPP